MTSPPLPPPWPPPNVPPPNVPPWQGKPASPASQAWKVAGIALAVMLVIFGLVAVGLMIALVAAFSSSGSNK